MPVQPRGPLRVAHVIYGLKLGGLEQLVVELACRARERADIEPMVLSFGVHGPLQEMLARRNVKTEWLGDVPGLASSTLRRMAQALDSFGAHLAHAHDLGPWLNAVAARALRSRTQVMATFHQLAPPTGKMRLAATAAAVFSKALVACGNEVRAEIEGWAPSATPLYTIGNGVPIPSQLDPAVRATMRERLGVKEGQVAIGYLGRMHEEKGPDRLLEAFLARFPERPDVHLYLIGAGPLEGALRERAKHAANVHFPGEVTDNAPALLQGLDIYAQGSRREGRSLSMLEAMGAALPTVAHDLPAIAEIHSEQTAILVPLGDVEAFGAALAKLASDAGLRARMGQAARKEVARYSVDAMVDDYVALYRGKRPPSAEADAGSGAGAGAPAAP